MNEKEQLKRAKELLKACCDLLEKQDNSFYVLNLLDEEIQLDGVECDGNCVFDTIKDFFEYGV